MKHLIEIPLTNGEAVIVEVDDAETSADTEANFEVALKWRANKQ